jgi:Tol biopolymer transport system component
VIARWIVGALLLVVLAAGSAAATAAPAKPVRNVLVYSKADPVASAGEPEHVWRAHVDGRGPRLVGRGDDPSVSPNGRWIAFGRRSKVLVVPTMGGKARPVYTLHRGLWLGEAPVWAPDSRTFALEDSLGLVVVSHPGRPTTRLLPRTGDLSFSPNSKQIAYEADGDLYVVPASGGKPLRLTDDHKSFGPVWGKTGIAFVRFTQDARGDVWLSDGHPRHARQLTHTGAGFWPSYFSANGSELLAANPATHDGRLWAVSVTSGSAQPLTPWTGDLVPQGLSGDGKTVLAAVGCGGLPGSHGYVETIPFAGGNPHVIVRGPCRASWNAR